MDFARQRTGEICADAIRLSHLKPNGAPVCTFETKVVADGVEFRGRAADLPLRIFAHLDPPTGLSFLTIYASAPATFDDRLSAVRDVMDRTFLTGD
jgi:hypothetical protein